MRRFQCAIGQDKRRKPRVRKCSTKRRSFLERLEGRQLLAGDIGSPVVVYTEENFLGQSWEISEGVHTITDLQNSPIGNDNASSFEIPFGFEVTVYQNGNAGGASETYTESMSTLGGMNDDISHLEVTCIDPIGEAGTISITDNWSTISLQHSYTDPVVIAGPLSSNETDPATVRIRMSPALVLTFKSTNGNTLTAVIQRRTSVI